jgi:hypothetical protein
LLLRHRGGEKGQLQWKDVSADVIVPPRGIGTQETRGTCSTPTLFCRLGKAPDACLLSAGEPPHIERVEDGLEDKVPGEINALQVLHVRGCFDLKVTGFHYAG